jgi:hypothetical protein
VIHLVNLAIAGDGLDWLASPCCPWLLCQATGLNVHCLDCPLLYRNLLSSSLLCHWLVGRSGRRGLCNDFEAERAVCWRPRKGLFVQRSRSWSQTVGALLRKEGDALYVGVPTIINITVSYIITKILDPRYNTDKHITDQKLACTEKNCFHDNQFSHSSHYLCVKLII